MGIVAAILLFLRSVFGVFVVAVVPWIFVELLSPFFSGKTLGRGLACSAVLAFLAVLLYKVYLIYTAYPCPSYTLPNVQVENCGFSAVLAALPGIISHVILAWFLLLLFISVGAVAYVYIPEDLNIHLRRYLATFIAVAVAVAWVVIFPWSAPLLLGL
ncbi:MAG: hypothetical protein GXN93_05015 [Candidatus Diapherotrites archaeon]|nr:hypothetical protein [Candidatus Diapherotrites archaeon]